MTALEVLFALSVVFVCYAYFGYALILYAISFVRSRPVQFADCTPTVAFIITVHNEELRIREKLENTLRLSYPADRLDIVVASDRSTDRTHEIVGEYAEKGVRLVVAPERRGKEFAQKTAIDATSSEVLVFTDVAARLDPGGLRTILRAFADPTVGCVSSADRLIDEDGRVSGEGAYVRYEMFLRDLESRVGSVAGLSGSFFAARRPACQSWETDIPSDFTTLLNTLKHGWRGISDREAIAYYKNIADERREYSRKVRTIVRGMSGLLRHLTLLNPFRYGLAAWQLCSHKLCRWLVPFALLTALITSLVLAVSSPFYAVLATLQVGVYVAAAIGMRRVGRLSGAHRLVTFLVSSNLSILHAWFQVARGRRVVLWEPSRR
jgi:cellulose synthase/poly-beta-1,6-N-acetylglucosamine synthase-like glycosyltransferase